MKPDCDARVIEDSWREPAAFAALFDRHFATIHRYLARRAGVDTADDLASEVFTVAFARRASYDLAHASALPWLYGIATNVLHAERRQRRRHDYVELVVDPVSGAEPLADRAASSLDGQREVAALAPLFRGLSEEDRTTALLYAWEHLSYVEIAQTMGVPVGTVRSRLNRVRRRLREPGKRVMTTTRYNHTPPTKEQTW